MWTEERIRSLIDARVPESLTLEFKANLPGRSDKDRSEFLKDVSGMANASGGAILYGVKEASGTASAIGGLRVPDADAEIRRLSQILESGIEPRLTGVRFTFIASKDGEILTLDVPESLDSPHRYVFNGHSKFVRRMGSHISELSYDQLRSAFDRSATRVDRLRAKWDDDLSLTKTWKPMIPGPVCVVRLSPLLSADGRQVIDPKAAYEHWHQLIFSDWGGGSSAFNYEGLAVFHGGRDQDSLGGYVQMHRIGALSAFRTARLTIDERKIIPSTTVGDFIFEAVRKFLRFSLMNGMRGSALLNVGLVRLSGYEFGARDRYGFEEGAVSQNDEIRFPEIWIEDIEAAEDSVEVLLRPGFDLLWQSYGWAGCSKFDSEGHWKPQ